MDIKKFGTAAFTALLKTILMVFNIIFTVNFFFFAILMIELRLIFYLGTWNSVSSCWYIWHESI